MKNFLKNGGLIVAGSVMSFASQAAPLSTDDFGTLQADITGTIATAAGIGISIMVVGLGWDVGMSVAKKFFKKGATA